MADFIDRITNSRLSRRTFIKASTAVAASLSLAGCSNNLMSAEAARIDESKGRWVPAACWHNCGGRCLNKALVVDGIVIRQKTDDTHSDTPGFPQQRGCARGRSQRRQVLGADRLKYPMKRKNWEPGGGKKELRGRDEWVRISWDEALDLIATETLRIKREYGNKSILGSNSLINALGGGLCRWGVSSAGAWPLPLEKMSGNLSQSINDRMEWLNTKLIVLWASNPAWSSAGNPTYNYLQAKKAGAKIIMVDPYYNDSAQILADEWIPVRPGTDTALLIAMAYYMITNNLQDQAFLDKYTVGFDAEHMPGGADPKENFKDYVLGTYDGQPKTPEWASEICGTDPQVIRALAQEVATTKPMVFSASYAAARTYRGQQFCQAFLTVGWMTGNVGISGGGVWNGRSSYGGPSLVRSGGAGLPFINNPLFPNAGPWGGYAFGRPFDTDFYGPAYEETWDAILKGEYRAGVRGKIPCDIRMLWALRDDSGDNILNQSADINKGIEAFRKLDFVVTNDIVLSTISKYADIVLPATTQWEKAGTLLTSNPESLFCFNNVINPIYEAKDEQWMERELAKRMGVNPDDLYPISSKQQYFNKIAGTTVINETGDSYEPLVTITQKDLSDWGVDGQPQSGRISLQEFQEKGVYQIPRAPGDPYSYIAGKEFRDDPEANPLATASGKLEIHCQALSDVIGQFGFTTLPPIAQYHPPVEGIEDTYRNWETKEKGDYPLQLYTIHSGRRSHSVFDNIQQLREAFPQKLLMNTFDALARGVREGDTVLIQSRHGKVIRPVALSERMMPGVVTLGEGAWVELDEGLGVDKAGATNILNGTNLSGQGEEPWNTCNVQVGKWAGEALQADYKWPQRVIDYK